MISFEAGERAVKFRVWASLAYGAKPLGHGCSCATLLWLIAAMEDGMFAAADTLSCSAVHPAALDGWRAAEFQEIVIGHLQAITEARFGGPAQGEESGTIEQLAGSTVGLAGVEGK